MVSGMPPFIVLRRLHVLAEHHSIIVGEAQGIRVSTATCITPFG
jgi:hypothetical protein